MIDKVFGTGGIGAGMFFLMEGNHTFGHDESRLAFLTDYRDYCKQHIILHYIAKLTKNIKTFAIGKVGKDEQGEKLIKQMQNAGILTEYVEATDQARTMLSICFQYPDGSGGNITTSNSACNQVTPEYIAKCSMQVDRNSVIVAVPEVPLDSRIRLLRIGRERGAFNTASILSGEIEEFEQKKGYALCDFLAVNIDEAKAISKTEGSLESIVTATAGIVERYSPNIKLVITAGKHGAYTFENGNLEQIHIIDVPVVSTAGAGDALFAGTITGLLSGMPFQKGRNDHYFAETSLESAVELGTIISTFSVMSPDTIAEKVTRENIIEFIKENHFSMSEVFEYGL